MIIDNIFLAAAAVFIILALIVGTAVLQKKRLRINTVQFSRRWQEIQKLCSNKATWPLAIIDGDKLLDEALKKSKFKGKTMGERLVHAQRKLSDNDGVWYAHKLRNKLVHEHYDALKEKDVKTALIGIRQALKDLGAIS